jgi:DnaJ-class molecular chaperone
VSGVVTNWPQWYWKLRAHHLRYKRHIEAMPRKLVCQDCGGMGGETDVILDDGTGPWEECGWCEGTGFVTPHRRGQWLRYKAGLRL